VNAIPSHVITTEPRLLDRTAFDEGFAVARSRLLAICRGLVGPDIAEDVVQDTYLRARGRIAQLRDPALLEAWLVRIAINLCFNWRRSNRRKETGGALEDAIAIAPEVRDYGLAEVIEGLPARDRTVIVLHYGYGYSLEEIARFVGASSTNTRSILFRARQRLGKRLREAER
jgi:RNA polymerase sigma-70 factor (ECF subfamily)